MPDALTSWPREGRPAVLVTGASSGIGREFARLAAAEGAELVLVARAAPALAALAAELGRAHAVPLDLAGPDAAAALGRALAERGLRCDVLVNNAGYGLLGLAAEADAAAQQGIVAVNVAALTALTLAALPGMLARGGGGVLNVASVAGFLPGPGMAAYYASKAYVRSFSEALWEEARGRGVAVTCLCPGPVETPFFDRAGAAQAGLFRRLPKADPRRVAEAGWRGLKAGRRLVFPDLNSRLTARLAPLLPRALLLPVVRRFQAGRGASTGTVTEG